MKAWRLGILALPGLLACSSQGSDAAASASGSAAPSAAPSASEAGAEASASPLSVVLEARAGLVLSSVEGGVVVAELDGKRLAIGRGGADLEERAAPEGLPQGLAGVLRVSGRLPDSLWLSVALPPEGDRKKGKTPFFRMSGGKLKELADDWQPLVVPWSKRRTLSLSTSSGKLKIKVIEPFTKTAPPDQPSRYVPDEGCAKTLKLAEAVALPDGEVLAAGQCALGSSKKSGYVLVRWPALAAGSAAPPPASPSASASAAPAEGPAAEGAAAEEDDRSGAPMSLTPISEERLRHRAIAARSADEIYLATTVEGGGASRVFKIEAGKAAPIELPSLEAPLSDLALSEAGELWIVADSGAYRRAPGEGWSKLAPPAGVTLERVEASGAAVYLAGRKADGSHVLLKLGPGKALAWN